MVQAVYIAIRKYRIALCRAILVASEVAPGILCSCDPALGQMLVEVTADELMVMWQSPILVVNEVINLISLEK